MTKRTKVKLDFSKFRDQILANVSTDLYDPAFKKQVLKTLKDVGYKKLPSIFITDSLFEFYCVDQALKDVNSNLRLLKKYKDLSTNSSTVPLRHIERLYSIVDDTIKKTFKYPSQLISGNIADLYKESRRLDVRVFYKLEQNYLSSFNYTNVSNLHRLANLSNLHRLENDIIRNTSIIHSSMLSKNIAECNSSYFVGCWLAKYYSDFLKSETLEPGTWVIPDKLFSFIYFKLYSNICVFLSEPISVITNESSRLHSRIGPAVEWRNGEKNYLWEGIPIPAKLYEEPDKLTISDIKTSNVEKRRAYIDILGLEKYFELYGGGALNEVDSTIDNQGNPMRLLKFRFQGVDRRVVELICPSTKRKYLMFSVDQRTNDVWKAKASIVGVTKEECMSMVNET